jgi:hypothetical protein
MPQTDDSSIEKRIEKDIGTFYSNLGAMDGARGGAKAAKVVELAKMYASDAKSYLDKKDFYTSFSCISYAHGLLDALKEISGD